MGYMNCRNVPNTIPIKLRNVLKLGITYAITYNIDVTINLSTIHIILVSLIFNLFSIIVNAGYIWTGYVNKIDMAYKNYKANAQTLSLGKLKTIIYCNFEPKAIQFIMIKEMYINRQVNELLKNTNGNFF